MNLFIIYSEKLILLAKKTKAFFWQQNKLWWAYQEVLFWKITAQSVLILCVWNPSYLMVAVFVSWSLYLQPILFHRKFLKERKKEKNLTSLNDISPWKSISESGSLQQMRDEVVFFMNFFFWLKEIKERFLLSDFFYSCLESPLITDFCKGTPIRFKQIFKSSWSYDEMIVDWSWLGLTATF